MLALHSYDSKVTKNFSGLYRIEALVMILSALKWRELNGDIKLYCDYDFYAWLKKIDFLDLYSVIDCTTLDKERDSSIDISKPYGFWASSKFYALDKEKTPFVMLDLDFISFVNLDYFFKQEYDFIAYCQENLSGIFKNPLYLVYPEKEGLSIPKDFILEDDLDWSINPINCSLVFYKNDDLKNFYVKNAFRYMKNNKIPDKNKREDFPPSDMCFIEQRYLPMLAKNKGYRYTTFLPGAVGTGETDRYMKKDNRFFHLWAAKYKPELVEFLYPKLKEVLHKKYPDIYERFQKIENTMTDWKWHG